MMSDYYPQGLHDELARLLQEAIERKYRQREAVEAWAQLRKDRETD